MIGKLFLFIPFLFLSSCVWQNEVIKSYNKNYDCQIEGNYFTKIYKNEDITIKDEHAYDKENKPVTGAVIDLIEEGDINFCITRYFKEGKKTKSKDVLSIKNKSKLIYEDVIAFCCC